MGKKNCIVAQSGGPTVAINANLAGVVKGVRTLRFLIQSMVPSTVF